MSYKTKEKQRLKSLEYYYKNKEKVLKYQKDRWNKKYLTDENFKKKRQLRDKSRQSGKGKMTNLLYNKLCSKCFSDKDLQRHHPSYLKIDFIILCRKCHNQLHISLREIGNQ